MVVSYLDISDGHLLGLGQRLVAVVEINLVVVGHESHLGTRPLLSNRLKGVTPWVCTRHK